MIKMRNLYFCHLYIYIYICEKNLKMFDLFSCLLKLNILIFVCSIFVFLVFGHSGHCGVAALQHCGIAALRHCGIAALWHCGVVSGAPVGCDLASMSSMPLGMPQCRNAAKPQCRNAAMTQCRNATMPQCHNARNARMLKNQNRTYKNMIFKMI